MEGTNLVGVLYLVGTPIGNLGDMTPRGLEVLGQADLIAAEDTRHTLELLNHFGIKNKLVRYDEHTKEKQGDFLLNQLQDGLSVALVSDAGLPGIADPGADLAKRAVAGGIRVVPVPGANAALTALIASGLPAQPFFFGGFLPKSVKNRKEILNQWKDIPATIIFYEAPHRILEVMRDILNIFGDREICLARELTKIHEEFWRGTLQGGIEYLSDSERIRGEYVLILAPPATGEETGVTLAELAGKVDALVSEGCSDKEAIQFVAKKYGVSRRDLYQFMLVRRGKKE